jgi:Mn2+/Fe2+ NRAMP family transporter
MGEHVNRGFYNFLAWTIAVVVSLLSLVLIVLTVLGWFGVPTGG